MKNQFRWLIVGMLSIAIALLAVGCMPHAQSLHGQVVSLNDHARAFEAHLKGMIAKGDTAHKLTLKKSGRALTVRVVGAAVSSGPTIADAFPNDPPPIAGYTDHSGQPAVVTPTWGQYFQLLWQTTGADTVTINGSNTGTPSGLMTVTTLAKTTTYTLAATNAVGTTTKSITETVTANPVNQPLAVIALSANPPSLPKGGGTTVVSWSVQSNSPLTTLQLDGENVAASGSKAFTLHNSPLTLTLMAVNAGGMSKQTITIPVAKH